MSEMPSDPRFQNLTGLKFGRLTVIAYAGKKNKAHHWLCRCDCGSDLTVWSHAFKRGNTKSCGCIKREVLQERNKVHGMSRGYLYAKWKGIKSRCYNKNNSQYHLYGERGIFMDENWKNDFTSFHEYVTSVIGHRPDDRFSIDRIDNDIGYVPGNIRWATCSEQNFNKRNNRLIELNGVKRPIGEWANTFGISVKTIRSRLYHLGWNVEKAICSPANYSGIE